MAADHIALCDAGAGVDRHRPCAGIRAGDQRVKGVDEIRRFCLAGDGNALLQLEQGDHGGRSSVHAGRYAELIQRIGRIRRSDAELQANAGRYPLAAQQACGLLFIDEGGLCHHCRRRDGALSRSCAVEVQGLFIHPLIEQAVAGVGDDAVPCCHSKTPPCQYRMAAALSTNSQPMQAAPKYSVASPPAS